MSVSLSEVLLRVASAIAADGGASVRAALEGVLREAVPFDAAEVVLVRAPGDTRRLAMGTAEGPLVGADLLAHVLAHGAAYRVDDRHDAEPFAETLGLLGERGLRSLLVVPFRFEEPGRPSLTGALAVGRSHGWSFVGASLPLLGPLAGMAGLALDRSWTLTTPGPRPHPDEPGPPSLPSIPEPPSPPAPNPASDPSVAEEIARLREAIEEARQTGVEREQERDRARDEAEGLRGEVASAAAALHEERAKNTDLLSRALAAEAARLVAEGSRDEWAQNAASRRTRTEEQDNEIQSLRRDIAGARETASSAAQLAEGGHARIRELQDQLQEREGRIGTLEAEARQREDEAHRLAEAAGRVASLERELHVVVESKDALEERLQERDARIGTLEERLREAEGRIGTLETERAALALETARLEAECVRLAAERSVLSTPPPQAPAKGRRGSRKARG